MERSESFPARMVSALVIRLKRAELIVRVTDDEAIQVQLLADKNVSDAIRHSLHEGRLLIEQPWPQLFAKGVQVVVSLPLDWKGSLEAHSIFGGMDVSGVTGSDLRLSSVAGGIRAEGLTGISIALKTAAGPMEAHDLACDDCALRTLTGGVTLSECGFLTCKARAFTGAVSLDLVSGFDVVEARSFTGSVSVSAPVDRADASLRSLSGRLLTEGVSIGPNAPRVSLTSATANLQLNCSLTIPAATI